MLSVVIPALNSASTISLTLSSIFSNEFSRDLFEVLVIDNGSTDNTVEIARKYDVRVYYCEPKGIGPPRNVGIKMAKGDTVCFTDSDCIVRKDWLKSIYTFFNQNPDADGVGGPVLSYPYCRNKIQKLTGELFEEDQRYPRKITKVQFGSLNGMIYGTNSAFKKDAILSAEGYSESSGSNLELVWRLASMGRNLFFSPNIAVYHIFPWKLDAIVKQQFRWGVQLTDTKRTNAIYRGTNEMVVISYFFVRSFLSLIDLRNLEKRLLHFTQLASFIFGQVYGRWH